MKLVTDINSSEYHSIKRREDGKAYCSKSTLWSYAKSPFSYKYGPPFEMTQKVKLGSYLDACLLDPDEKANFYTKGDNPYLTTRRDGVKVCSTKEARQWRDNKEKKGCYDISDAEKYQVEQNLQHIRNHPAAQELLRDNAPQTAMFGEILGVPFKGLIDIVPHKESKFGDGLADLKRTGHFHPWKFNYHVKDMGYHVQAKSYLMLWNAIQSATGGDDFRDKFYFLVSNDSAPYECGVAECSQASLANAELWLKTWIPQWRHSVETDVWPNPYDQGEGGIYQLD